jgi:outer membrane protein assembly factor BamA
MSRFNRIELGFQAVNVGEATLELQTKFDAVTGGFVEQSLISGGGASATYVQPSLAHIHDNTLFGYVGPFAGSRSRFSIAPAIGSWRFISGLVDYRRYIWVRPFTLAARGIFMGRYGRDADRFPIFLGNTELIRGYTSGSFRSHECALTPGLGTRTACAQLDQLIGSKIAVANVELRFPLARSLVLGFLPIGLPPIEGAIFYDIGVAWYDASNLKWNRAPTQDPLFVRTPLRSWGASIRANVVGLMILRFDYSKPMDRPYNKGFWTVSIGPTF